MPEMMLRTFATFCVLWMAGTAIATADCANPRDWGRYSDPEFGMRIDIPYDCFAPAPQAPSGQSAGEDAKLFQSEGGRVSLAVYRARNADGASVADFRRWLMTEVGGYGNVTYGPMGRSWFVLSGYRGDIIYYEKYALSRGGAAIAGFALEFPRSMKPIVAPIIERMEDSFRTG